MLKAKVKEVYDFKKVIVPVKLLEIEVSEKTITDALTDVSERFLTIEEVDNAIAAGDIISADLESSNAKYNKKKTQISVGRGFFNKELEDNLLGMKKNETKAISINGNSVIIRIINIKRRIFANVTDELINKLNIEGVNTISEYKKYIYNNYIEQSKNKKMRFAVDFIMKEVVAKSEFESIDEEAKLKYENMVEQFKQAAAQRDTTYEDLIIKFASEKLKNPTVEESEKYFYNRCITDVKKENIGLFFALVHGYEFNQENYEKKLNEMVKLYGIPYENLKQMVPFSQYITAVCDEYCTKVISEFYMGKFVITEKKA